MYVYIRKLFEHDVSGHQISFTQDVAMHFFEGTKAFIERRTNSSIHVYHFNDKNHFEDIELQTASDYRFSTKLNTLLQRNGDVLDKDDLLYIEKISRCYGVKIIKTTNPNYKIFNALLNQKDRHLLLCMDDDEEKSEEESEQNTPESSNRIENQGLVCLKYRPYITAIKSKPFLLLAGISGTGKSRIVRELARACWPVGSDEYDAQKPKNFEMIQVRPNWHDSTELIGYVSRIGADKDGNGITYVVGDFLKFLIRAWGDLKTPYFLCLDEMNLAPVEQYFAEYLSVIETRRNVNGSVKTDPILKSNEQWFFDLTSKLSVTEENRQFFNENGISIPPNLIVIGTVNMDETTFSFSRKVLDRAMTIEMNEVDLYGGLRKQIENIGLLGSEELIGTAIEGVDVYEDYKAVCDIVIDYLQKINNLLNDTPFKIAYRTRNEYLLYVVNNLVYNKDEDGTDLSQGFIIARALDEITSMKILSRIEGDETKVTETFLTNLSTTIKNLLYSISDGEYDALAEYSVSQDINKPQVLSISLSKLSLMIRKLSSGYTSFWS